MIMKHTCFNAYIHNIFKTICTKKTNIINHETVILLSHSIYCKINNLYNMPNYVLYFRNKFDHLRLYRKCETVVNYFMNETTGK